MNHEGVCRTDPATPGLLIILRYLTIPVSLLSQYQPRRISLTVPVTQSQYHSPSVTVPISQSQCHSPSITVVSPFPPYEELGNRFLLLILFISQVSEMRVDGSCMVRVTTGYHDLNLS